MNKDAIPGRVSTDEVDTVALAASLLFMHGQTTERTVVAAQQLGRALGVPVRVLPHWDELVVELDHTSFSEIVPAAPLGIDGQGPGRPDNRASSVRRRRAKCSRAPGARNRRGYAARRDTSLHCFRGHRRSVSRRDLRRVRCREPGADRRKRRRRGPCPSMARKAWRQSFPRTAFRGHDRRLDRRHCKSPPPFRRAPRQRRSSPVC